MILELIWLMPFSVESEVFRSFYIYLLLSFLGKSAEREFPLFFGVTFGIAVECELILDIRNKHNSELL